MNEPKISDAAPSLPGVPAGKPPVAPVAPGKPVDYAPGLAGGKSATTAVDVRKLFGGNVGKKPHASGFKSGSPEAIEFDRVRDAERKRREREEKRLATPPPVLPAGVAPPVEAVSGPAEALAGAAVGEAGDPVLLWTAEDFRQAAPELVELAEAWRVDSHTRHAAAGKLPKIVVEEIAKSAAFPAGSKKSLSTASPVTLAKMFNALKVPVLLKSVISAAPALAYIIVRDLQTSARIEKMIQDEAERAKAGDKK